MDNVIRLVPKAIGDGVRVDCDAVLAGAVGKLEECIVIGVEKNGDLYIAGTDGLRDTIYLMELAKSVLLTVE